MSVFSKYRTSYQTRDINFYKALSIRDDSHNYNSDHSLQSLSTIMGEQK